MDKLPETLTDRTIIRENQRFSTLSATYQGEKVFVKQVRDTALEKAIRDEQWGIEAFRQILQVRELPFNVPKVILGGEDFLVTSWVDGEPMSLVLGSEDFDSNISFLASCFAEIDAATALASPMKTSWARPGDDGRTLYEAVFSRLSLVPHADFFDDAEIQRAVDFVNANVASLEARFTHADLTPANILVANGQKTLIDFESTSMLWPRFYDVVNMTINRYVLEPELSDAMMQLFHEFIQKAEVDTTKHMLQLNTIAMLRAISLIVECMSEPDAFHNTNYAMTPEIAAKIKSTMGRIASGRLFL